MRAWVRTPNPKTPAQHYLRSTYTQTYQQWQTSTTDAQRANWDQYAKEYPNSRPINEELPITGFQAFMQVNLTLNYFELTPLMDAPTNRDVTTGLTASITDNDSTTSTLTVTIPETPALTEEEYWILYATPCISQGRRTFAKYLRQFHFSQGTGDISEFDNWQTTMSAIPNPTPNLVAGTRIGMTISVLRPSNGARSAKYAFSSVTT